MVTVSSLQNTVLVSNWLDNRHDRTRAPRTTIMMPMLRGLSRSNVEKRGKEHDLGGESGSAQRLTRRDFLKAGGVALASAYVLGMTGCGGSQSQGGKVTLTYANWVASEAATRATITKAIKAFEKQN